MAVPLSLRCCLRKLSGITVKHRPMRKTIMDSSTPRNLKTFCDFNTRTSTRNLPPDLTAKNTDQISVQCVLSSFSKFVKSENQMGCQLVEQTSRSLHTACSANNFANKFRICDKKCEILRNNSSLKSGVYNCSRQFSRAAILDTPRAGSNTTVKQSNRKKTDVQAELKKVTAYATAEEYEMGDLRRALEAQGLYALTDLPEDVKDVIHAEAKYTVDEENRELFIFRDGGVVLWNMPEVERNEFLKFLKRYSYGEYKLDMVIQELEQLQVKHAQAQTNLFEDTVHLKEKKEDEEHEEGVLEKYAFSNSLAQSVKLGIWEATLQKFVSSIEPVTEDLKAGRHVNISRREALQKIGEIFALRHQINLSSDLLDTPDFYWERDHLERLYLKTSRQLMISRRTRVVNEKLNYCVELMELLNSHMNDAHHVRLEWMIILLIMVEVAFEVLRHIEKYMILDKLTRPSPAPKNVSSFD